MKKDKNPILVPNKTRGRQISLSEFKSLTIIPCHSKKGIH